MCWEIAFFKYELYELKAAVVTLLTVLLFQSHGKLNRESR